MQLSFHKTAGVLAALLFIGLGAPALAIQDCAASEPTAGPTYLTGPDCTISWVERGQLHTVIWRQVQTDFQDSTLEHTVDGPVLTSSYLPDLIDMDQDGWLDLVTFMRVGMVNGTFAIFFRDPDSGQFKPPERIYGHTLTRDRDGYIVAGSRNGAGQLLQLYTAVDQTLSFQVEIDPFALPPSGSTDQFSCDISAVMRGGIADPLPIGKVPDNPDLLEYYCEPSPTGERRDVDIGESPASVDRAPTSTVFYCRLEGGTHAVTISQTPTGMRYRYGPLNAEAELVMDRPMDEVHILPENGAGPSRFGEISFDRGAYTYTAYYSFELFNDAGELIQSDPDSPYPNDSFSRGLTVTRDGDAANPVFKKDCLLGHSYDSLTTLQVSP